MCCDCCDPIVVVVAFIVVLLLLLSLTTVMSYSSDPETKNRDLDSASIASTSTSSSPQLKIKKKPWSKFKSSIKTIGEKMSSKPKFAESTESSEQRRVKKNKKHKGNNNGGGSEEGKPSSSGENMREKSPSKGAKGLIKKLSVESLATPYVGYQPSSVGPTKSYAKALHKSASTSESNLSASDVDTPRKSMTLDKNTKYGLSAQDSPDSGRVSQTMDDSRPPSQVAEERYSSKEATSDFSGDSDFTSSQKSAEDVPFDKLVAQTEQFAQSLASPATEKEKDVDVSEDFIKEETKVLPSKAAVEPSSAMMSEKTKVQDGSKDGSKEITKKEDASNPEKVHVTKEEIDGRKKVKNKTDKTSAEFILSEQTEAVKDKPTQDTKPAKSEGTLGKEKGDVKTLEETQSKSEDKTEKNVEFSVPENEKGSSKDSIPKKEESTDPKTPTPSPDPKTPTPSQATEKSQEESVKTPPKSLDVSSPLTDPPSPGPTMSVEEKLEAFLSAEGWSGPKDVATQSKDDVSQQPDKRECLYKILVIGELGTGKTSIIKRYVHQFFSQHYRATIGVDFALKVLNWDSNTIIRLQLWDIAGQERFGNMTRVYYKEAVGAFIVFDVTRSATFDAVLKWKQDLDSKVQLADGNPIPCVLLANKCDQQKEGIVNNPSKMEEYCKENNFSGWFETSAKENINIDEAAKTLVTQILQNDKMSQNGRDSARDGSKFPLDGNSEKESKSCAC